MRDSVALYEESSMRVEWKGKSLQKKRTFSQVFSVMLPWAGPVSADRSCLGGRVLSALKKKKIWSLLFRRSADSESRSGRRRIFCLPEMFCTSPERLIVLLSKAHSPVVVYRESFLTFPYTS